MIRFALLIGYLLHLHGDGTASVRGVVTENHLGCVADGECYFRLKMESTEVRVVYSPGETAQPVANIAQASALMKVRPGAEIEAFGFHSEHRGVHFVDVYSKAEFFVRVEREK